jgi:hypothetical protein
LHFPVRGGQGIADLILQRIASAAKSLQQGAMIALLEDRRLWPVLFVLGRALLISAAQHLGDARIELW